MEPALAQSGFQRFLYRLYSPETTGPADKKPLIVWRLHPPRSNWDSPADLLDALTESLTPHYANSTRNL